MPLTKGKKGLLKQIAYQPVLRWLGTTDIYDDKCIRCIRCHCLGEILISLQKKNGLFLTSTFLRATLTTASKRRRSTGQLCSWAHLQCQLPSE